MNEKKRGGLRPGAGRPFKTKEGKKMRINLLLRPSTLASLRRLKEYSGLAMGEVLDAMFSGIKIKEKNDV